MALIKIENAKVIRHVGANGAFAIEEPANTAEGRNWPETFTVWAKGQPPAIDSIVNVTGRFGKKGRIYGDNKVAVDVNVNEPQVTVVEALNENAPF